MKEKMTSGELARRTGVSQKAIRLYDEKGLLCPTAYSEGNYRLYDEEALFTLEKIIALKQVGFSLEEIRENLIAEKGIAVQESLLRQIRFLSEKKKQLENAIACLENALRRCDGEDDWDSMAEAMRNIQINREATDRGQYYRTKKSGPWYSRIYRSLEIRSGERILDLGCGRGFLWLDNWEALPEKVRIDAVDLHGSGADSFAADVAARRETLPQGVQIRFWWQDAEEASLWEALEKQGPYQRIIAHYFLHFLRNDEQLLDRCARLLSPEGLFCCNGPCISREYHFWKKWLEDRELDTEFISRKLEERRRREEEFLGKLGSRFERIKSIELSNELHFETAEEVLERLLRFFPDCQKMLYAGQDRITAYAAEEIEEAGEIIVPISSTFRQCSRRQCKMGEKTA